MKNKADIFWFEVKKIAGRRITVCAFLIILFATVLLNLQSIPLYSVGTEGEQLPSPEEANKDENERHAFFHGITIRWIDETGNEVQKKVSPLQYIRLQKRFAKKWSGQYLDDETIQNMQAFIEEYAHEQDGYLDGWSYQNYYWVWKSISHLGLTPMYPALSAQGIRELLKAQTDALYDELQLSEKEKAFGDEHETLAFPLELAYTPAYREILYNIRWIHLMLLFFVILTLCDSFSMERKHGVRPTPLSTKRGHAPSVLAKTAAGLFITVSSGLILFFVTFSIQFLLFGTDGWHTPIQQLGGLQWSRLMINCGEAVLLMCGTSLVILIAVAAITMFLSELTRSGILPMWLQFLFLMATLIFDYGIFYRNRVLAQVWSYLPIQRVADTLLYDERLVRVGSHLFTAIPFSTCMYLFSAVMLLTLCTGHALIFRYEK